MLYKPLIYVSSYFGLFSAILFLLTMFENRNRLKNPVPKRLPTITIAVPAYNEEKTIIQTIKSLLSLDYPKKKLKIFVIDDGSTDNTYNLVKQLESAQVKVFTKKNEGKGVALNVALSKCSTEFFASFDADSFVSRETLKKMVGYFEDPNVMAVTPSLKVYSSSKFTVLQRIQAIEYLLGAFLRKVFGLMGAIHVTPGPLSIYRKAFFDKYGGYDEKNITEDIEVALRIHSLNYQIENSADAEVRTIAPASFVPLFKQRIRWFVGFIENVWRYKQLFGLKHGDLGLFFLPAAIISVVLVISLTIYLMYSTTTSSFKNFINLQSINFDILTIIKNIKLDSFFINTEPILFLSVLGLIAAILIVNIAKEISKEKDRIKKAYVFYMLFYCPLFTLWWLSSAVIILTRKKINSWKTK